MGLVDDAEIDLGQEIAERDPQQRIMIGADIPERAIARAEPGPGDDLTPGELPDIGSLCKGGVADQDGQDLVTAKA